MKASLLIQIEDGKHALHTFPDHSAYLKHIEREEAHAQAHGLKTRHEEVTRQPRKTDVLITYRGSQPAPLPTRQQIAAILKQYKEDGQ